MKNVKKGKAKRGLRGGLMCERFEKEEEEEEEEEVEEEEKSVEKER